MTGFILIEDFTGYQRKSRKILYVSKVKPYRVLEEEQTLFPAWLGWRAGGKEEERRYFHCLQQNRNSSSQTLRSRGLKRRNDIPSASRAHLQLVFENHFHKYLPGGEAEKYSLCTEHEHLNNTHF